MTKSISFLFILMVVSHASFLFAGVKNYTDGNAVLSLAVDGDKLLAGTEGGVVIWDLPTKTCRKITTREALPNNKVTGILVDGRRGTWWFATHRGVCRYDGKRWTAYGIKNGLNSMWINRLYLDDEGVVWAATRRGVNWFDGYEWRNLPGNREGEPVRVYGMVKETAGAWWFTDRGRGLFRLGPRGRLKRYERVNGIPSLFARRVVTDRDGTLWFGTYRGVISYDGRTWKRYGEPEGLTSLQIHEIFIDHNNTPWVGTTHGASCYQDGRWRPLELGSLSRSVTAFAEDGKGNLYIGTRNGIGVYHEGKITVMRTDDPVRGVIYTDAVAQSDGTLWFSASDGGGIVSFDGQEWKRYGAKEGLTDRNVLCLAVDPGDTVWAGTHHGAFRFHRGRWEAVARERETVGNNICAIAFPRGRLAFGTHQGLFVLRGDRWTRYTEKQGLPDRTVLALLADGQRCYVGTLRGLAIFTNGKFTPVEALKGEAVHSLLKTGRGVLYVGTDRGLFEITKGRARRLGIRDGLFDLRVSGLARDEGGNLWVSTARGLSRYDGERFVNFTRDEGFADDRINAVLVDREGIKWLATAQGISRFDDRLRFDCSRYVGLSRTAVLTLRGRRLHPGPDREKGIVVTVRNVTEKREVKIRLTEDGSGDGTFRGELRFAPVSGPDRRGRLPVSMEKSNFLVAELDLDPSGPMTARAFWRNDFFTGNLNGDAQVSRRDAILAEQIVSGLEKAPFTVNADLDHDGTVDSKDVVYARNVNTGRIHPWDMAENTGPPIRPAIASVLPGRRHKGMFAHRDLPWVSKRIPAGEGGVLKLENLVLEIPPGALDEDTLITVVRGERTPSPTDLSVYPVGAGFNLYPAGLVFKRPVRLTLGVRQSDLEEAGVTYLDILSLGCWNGRGYDALPSYPHFRERRVTGFLHAFPENLLRPDRPAFAVARTAPVMNYLYPSNYFSLITVVQKPPLILHETPASGPVLKRRDPEGTDSSRLFVIDGKDQRLLLDLDHVEIGSRGLSLNTLSCGKTIRRGVPPIFSLFTSWFRRFKPFEPSGKEGIGLAAHTPCRIGLIGPGPKGNRASLSTVFYVPGGARVTALKIIPDRLLLGRGSRFRFIGLGIAGDGLEIPLRDSDWSARGADARIDPDGRMTVGGEGSGRVRLVSHGLTAEASYRVSGAPVLTRVLVAPQVQVVRVNEERDYQAVGIDQYGHRIPFTPEWSIESRGGDGVIDSKTGHFRATREGIYFVKATGGPGISKKVISFIGGCTWCHFFGK